MKAAMMLAAEADYKHLVRFWIWVVTINLGVATNLAGPDDQLALFARLGNDSMGAASGGIGAVPRTLRMPFRVWRALLLPAASATVRTVCSCQARHFGAGSRFNERVRLSTFEVLHQVALASARWCWRIASQLSLVVSPNALSAGIAGPRMWRGVSWMNLKPISTFEESQAA
ncbi:hypothetical protein X742_05645 [Mesorhizobium sp. LNHC232B00]|nr:hypothetical protein X742_05645 [Mesorhizobium sp. LNHC232B00]